MYNFNANKKTALVAIFLLMEGHKVWAVIPSDGESTEEFEIVLNDSCEGLHPCPNSLHVQAPGPGKHQFYTIDFESLSGNDQDDLSFRFDTNPDEDWMDQIWLEHQDRIILDESWELTDEEHEEYRAAVQNVIDVGKKLRAPVAVVGFDGKNVHCANIGGKTLARKDHGIINKVSKFVTNGFRDENPLEELAGLFARMNAQREHEHEEESEKAG